MPIPLNPVRNVQGLNRPTPTPWTYPAVGPAFAGI